jgi:C4-dicarboxylate-specific signal transduction histidine kinase
VGQVASALAHELSQPLGATLRNAEAAKRMLLRQALAKLVPKSCPIMPCPTNGS